MAFAIGQRIGRRVVTGTDRWGYTLLRCDCGGEGRIPPPDHLFQRGSYDYCQRRDCHEHGAVAATLVVGSRVGRLVATSERTLVACGHYMRTWRCDCGRELRMAEQRPERG